MKPDPRIEAVARARCIELGDDPDSLTNRPPRDDIPRTGPFWTRYEHDARLFVASYDAVKKLERGDPR